MVVPHQPTSDFRRNVSLRLPRTTVRPTRKRRGECSGLRARAASQSLGGKSVVRGLPPNNVGKGQEFALCS